MCLSRGDLEIKSLTLGDWRIQTLSCTEAELAAKPLHSRAFRDMVLKNVKERNVNYYLGSLRAWFRLEEGLFRSGLPH